MEPDRGKSSIYGGESATMNLSCNFSSIQIIRKRRRAAAVDEDDNYCSHNSHSVRMLFSYPLVALTTCLIMCFIPHPTHALPFDGSLLAGNSGSLSNSHRSHLDLLIDPIHQAEFGDEELESKKVVAKSVFDMVLRTPPPPTSSSTRCPPGTQSPFEGGPCITKSKEPVAVVDQLFLLDTLRGLTRDGVLLGGGSTRTRRPGGGGGHNRRRPSGKPKMPTTTTTTTTTIKTTTQPPTTTITTEIPPETTLMQDVSDSGLEDVTQQSLSSFDVIPASMNTFRPAVAAFENPKLPDVISLDKVASAEDVNGKRIAESGINVEEVTFVPTPSTTVPESDQDMSTLPTEIPTTLFKDDPESGFNNGNQVSNSTTLAKSKDSPVIESATEKNYIPPQSITVLPPRVRDSGIISAEMLSPEMQPTANTNGHTIRERPNPLTVSNFTDATTTMKSASSVTFTMKEPLGQDIISQPISESEITVLEQSKEMTPNGAVVEMTDVTQQTPPATTLSSDRNITSPRRENADAFNHNGEKGVESPITIKMMNMMNNMEISPDQLKTDNSDGETDKLSTTYSSLIAEKEDEMLLLDPSPMSPSSDIIPAASDRESSTEDESKFGNKAKVLIITGVDSAGVAEEQMMTTGDKNMTGAQPVSLVEKEQGGKLGDDHPSFSTTAVNHLPISEIGLLVGDQTEDKDVGEAVDLGSMDATSTVDDLVVINNHTVSPAHHHHPIVEETKQQEQVIVNKDGEIADPPLKSSSSREYEETGDQQVLPEIKSPELATILIPPSTTVSSSTFHPKDTLLQFQLPIVTRGPTASNNFQNFPEFPSGRIRFPPQDADTATGHYSGTTFRGTLRPLLDQDFQLDYPPREFLRANHPSFNTDLGYNPAAQSAAFKEQKPQQEWQTLKPFPSATSAPTVDAPESSTASEYDNASTEYLESELDRRHQKTRSRNRIKYSEATTNQPVPPEFIKTFYPASAEIQQQSSQQHHPPTPPRQQQFLYGRRNPSADLITFGYLNFRHGHDRTHHNTRRLVW